MDKFGPFKPDEETIESWLDALEARLICNNVTTGDKKRQWCQALVGEAGRNIVKKLPARATWDQVKLELCEILGESNPKERAFDDLMSYKSGDKGLGEIAIDIMTKASLATDDIDAQHRLGLRAFLRAVPDSLGKELRRKHFRNVKEALEEARFLKRVSAEEGTEREKVLTVEKDDLSPQQIIEECLKRFHADNPSTLDKTEQPQARGGKVICWCCKQEGHTVWQCPVVAANRALSKGSAPKPQGNASGGQIGTFVAPLSEESSPLIFERVRVAGVDALALIDTGATTSCCRWGWYRRWSSHLGPLRSTDKKVIGVGNCPIDIKGIAHNVKITWGRAESHFEMMVLSTLKGIDIILGMDVLGKLGIIVDAREGRARPRQPSPEVACKIVNKMLRGEVGPESGNLLLIGY